jgi:hypothetical protein
MEARQELTLRPRRAKQAAFFALCAGFCAGSLFMIRDGEALGWFPLVFFGLCTLVLALDLIPGASYLKLDPEGFTVRSLFRSSWIAWGEIEGFAPGRVGANRGVVFDLVPGSKRAPRLRRVNAAISGAECALPDTYGLSCERLADLLNEWKHGLRRLDP